MARKKRKNFEIDIGSVKPKKAKTSEHDKNKIKHVQDGSDSPTTSKTKNWEQALKLKKSSHKIMKKKKLQGSYKNSEKNKKASHINMCRTEALDKKREARKKRRAKGKVCHNSCSLCTAAPSLKKLFLLGEGRLYTGYNSCSNQLIEVVNRGGV